MQFLRHALYEVCTVALYENILLYNLPNVNFHGALEETGEIELSCLYFA